MLPLFAFFVAKALFGPLLYWRHVGCRLRDIGGAALAGMALSHSVARGVFTGLGERGSVFEVTRKGSAGAVRRKGRWAPVREELFLAAGLLVCLAGVALSRKPDHTESAMWMTVLALQSLPYLATLACNALAGLAPRPADPDDAASREPAPQARPAAVSERPAAAGPLPSPAKAPLRPAAPGEGTVAPPAQAGLGALTTAG
jgi:hypothetical protein